MLMEIPLVSSIHQVASTVGCAPCKSALKLLRNAWDPHQFSLIESSKRNFPHSLLAV